MVGGVSLSSAAHEENHSRFPVAECAPKSACHSAGHCSKAGLRNESSHRTRQPAGKRQSLISATAGGSEACCRAVLRQRFCSFQAQQGLQMLRMEARQLALTGKSEPYAYAALRLTAFSRQRQARVKLALTGAGFSNDIRLQQRGWAPPSGVGVPVP